MRTLPWIAAAAFLLLGGSPDQARAERFSHKVHAAQGAEECRDCHSPGAISIIPARPACLACHSEKELADTPLGPTRTHTGSWPRLHGSESASPGAQCRSCHDASFCVECHAGGEIGPDLRKQVGRLNLPPRNHTARFTITHPLKAQGNGVRACRSCHQDSFCNDCHQKSLPPGTAAPASHRRSWKQIEAGMGGPLHSSFTEAQCRDCHPGGALSASEWSRGHAAEARRNLSACRSCHPQGDVCSSCHSAKSGLMVSPHPSNWGRIKSKFRRQAPQVCDQCHSAGVY